MFNYEFLRFYFILAILFCSCDNDESSSYGNLFPEGVVLGFTGITLFIVDSDFQDLLNPESSGYFGEEIKVKYLHNDISEPFKASLFGQTVFPPPDTVPLRCYFGCYYIVGLTPSLSLPFVKDDNGSSTYYYYICYPDGNEDEIKVEVGLFTNKLIPCGSAYIAEKIWINGELVCEMLDFEKKDFYLNPEYYPLGFWEPIQKKQRLYHFNFNSCGIEIPWDQWQSRYIVLTK